MSESVKMPALGESVTEGTVSSWLKAVGDTVEADEPLLEVATDKVDTEVPSPASGVLLEIRVPEDETVEVGTVLAIIGDPSEAGSAPAPAAPAPQAAPEPPAPAPTPAAEAPAPAAPQAGGSAEGTEVKMPALGESVTEGTVSSWLKAVGDTVEADEPLLEVATDKVDTEVPSPASGVLLEIRVPEDETVEVGTVLAIIGDPSDAGSAPAPAARAPHAAPDPPAPAPAPAATAAPAAAAPVSSGASGSYVTPIVRKLAKDKGVDLSTVTGTGVGGRIRKQDVEAAAKAAEEARAAAAAPAPATEASAPAAAAKPASAKPEVDTTLRGRTEKMSRLRQVIADRMIDSLQTSAQLTTVVEVDVTRVAALRARAKNDFLAKNGTKLTFLPFFVQAATEALKAHPKINASIEGKNVTYHDVEHVGIAVDTPRGLLVPVVKNAGDLNIPGLAKRINDLAARTRDNKVNPDELSGSTFTITNTGSGGALFDTPIINQPEVAILGLGAIQRQPRVIKDADGGEVIAIRSVCYLALSYDHRLVDGADAARYLMTVKKRLEEGDFGGELGL
ncbi:2-oxoglutarate dehydrogenase, E2 component, dihydrolipoamide succinyltransferase [Actinomyces sp. oral taxon 175]|uniref:2-oxoglutarate dehydrogenase, E2 component, dihydrolipoamide succinyltransferase n=1 Tax=Actinomyces sp. oral taxon 175 TaxID=712119 RepID=UPI00021D2B34|nr:2-oxoglutarate dehydrogenase, E2 component, dihydrolipoamide succinyltransferase [Actinomyces sp. oral taxon 175]EGV14533.1 2-oxoglutarate dehydrogenase, E2 component, dihydrolipoamide succinyltransferase [Actinomyces sp. oral taxon 175 str. F0384]